MMDQPRSNVESDASGPGGPADDLFAHGLLHVVHETGPEARERRVQRVMEGLAVPAARVRADRRRRRFSRFMGAGSLLAGLAAAIVFLASPVTTPTYASIEDSITAMRAPGDRRYQISAVFGTGDLAPASPHAFVDTSFPDLMLLRLHRPDGQEVIAGRDQTGEWAITPEGTIDRENPRRAWPGWANQDGESMFADSIDRWLEAAAQAYSMSKPERVKLPGTAAGEFDHVVGIRKPTPGPLAQRLRSADRIEVWMDPVSKVVERMELSWRPPPMEMPGGPGMRPGGGPGLGDRPRDGLGEGPGPRRGRPPRPPEGEDRPPHPQDGPPPPGEAREDGPRGERAGDEGPPPRRAGPVGLENSEERGHVDGEPPRDPLEEGADARGPRPPRQGAGPGTNDRPGDGRGARPGPGGPPRRPPLRRLVIERVDSPAFENGWFTPEGHVKDAAGISTPK